MKNNENNKKKEGKNEENHILSVKNRLYPIFQIYSFKGVIYLKISRNFLNWFLITHKQSSSKTPKEWGCQWGQRTIERSS